MNGCICSASFTAFLPPLLPLLVSYLLFEMANMGIILAVSCMLSLILFFPTAANSQSSFTCSRATYYGSPECSGTPTGACGYGEFGRDVNGGNVAAVSRLYRNGSGCGACYQIRCKYPGLCNDNGVRIVVTDHGESDYTDFILSASGFARLAQTGVATQLMAYGVIDIEFRRIPCQYPGYNLLFKVTENSKYPDYLALVILYQAGQKDIVAVELSEEDGKEWRAMRRAYGAVWDIVSPPEGRLSLRFQTDGDDGQSWVQLAGVVPEDWKAGVSYDSAMQLT